MDTLTILKKNGGVMSIEDFYYYTVSGNNLIVTTKTTEVDACEQAWLFTINTVYDLDSISNYTVKTKTEQYGKNQEIPGN